MIVAVTKGVVLVIDRCVERRRRRRCLVPRNSPQNGPDYGSSWPAPFTPRRVQDGLQRRLLSRGFGINPGNTLVHTLTSKMNGAL